MKKKFLAKLAVGLAALITAGIAQATLVIYNDQASFLTHAGSVTGYDFESDATGYISSPSYSGGNAGAVHDFGDFSIDATSNGIYLAEIRGQNGNNDIYLNSYNNNAALNVIFDNDISAFGFTYIAEGNQSWDKSIFSLLGNSWVLGIPGDSGFFGVIETSGTIAAGTAFSFGQNSTNWSGLSFDNIVYSSNGSSPVPEPTTLFLFGIGIVGLAGTKTKIKRK